MCIDYSFVSYLSAQNCSSYLLLYWNIYYARLSNVSKTELDLSIWSIGPSTKVWFDMGCHLGQDSYQTITKLDRPIVEPLTRWISLLVQTWTPFNFFGKTNPTKWASILEAQLHVGYLLDLVLLLGMCFWWMTNIKFIFAWYVGCIG